MSRTAQERLRDREDLLAYVREHEGPVCVRDVARESWDGTTPWGQHLGLVIQDITYWRRQRFRGRASQGPQLVIVAGHVWNPDICLIAPVGTPAADAAEDRAEVRRMLSAWEPAD